MQNDTAATAFNVTCPRCGQRLRFALSEESPGRLRVQCSACSAVFGVRRPGADRTAPLGDPPTLTGIPIAGATANDGDPHTSPLLRDNPGAPAGGRSGGDSTAFGPGEVVALRYRVVRFIARGGMGEVYEVEDAELGERVALKTVRSEAARDGSTVERFKREIQLARKVTHPNVCRIFDVSFHRPEASPGAPLSSPEPIIFLTMELLSGETLGQHLERRGPLPAAEVLPLARQIAAALHAAHQAGIVHRDLKPGNVVLAASGSAPGGAGPSGAGSSPGEGLPRAVVTDFGLARSNAGDQSLTLTSATIIGTPGYIAPEQVEGKEITPAADIFAFGVLLYEMLTGKLPFVGDTAVATAVKRLTEAPPPPTVYAPDLDPRWEATILRCLERDPARRFATTLEVVEALEGRPVEPANPALSAAPAPSGLSGRDKARQRRRSLALLALLVAAGIAVGLYRYQDWRARQREARARLHLPEGPIVHRRSVAVLGFADRSGRPDSAWLSAALSEMLATELANGEDLRVISGEEVARAKLELKLGNPDSLARDTLGRVRHLLGTDYVVLGSYVALDSPGGRQVRLDLRLQDTTSGETPTAAAESGTEAHLFDLVSRLGLRLRHTLGSARAVAGNPGARSSLPASPEAARLYAEGITRLRLFDPAGARDLLLQAAAVESGNALVHESLASAWATLGYEEKAKDEARRALDLSRDLPQEERLRIEGHYREALGEWPKAVEIYKTLWSQFPDNLDYGLRLAAALGAAGQPEEALATVEGLRTLPAPASEDARIDLAEATAAGAVGDLKRQQQAASRAAAKGATQGARLLVGRARLAECRALRNLGQADAALAACKDGRRLHAEAGDRAGVAESLTHEANVLYDRGDLAGAEGLYQQALATYRDLGNRGGEAAALNNIAVVLKSRGELDRARELYEQVLNLTRELGSRGGEAYALNNIAAVLLRHGQLAKAREMFEQSLKVRHELQDRSGEAYALDNIGVVLRRQGDLTGALARHGESLKIRQEIGQKIGEVTSLDNLGSVLLDRGDLAQARDRFTQSLGLAQKLGNQSGIAHALFGLGEVQLRQGQIEEAARHHAEGLAIRDRLGEKGNAAESRLALAALKLEQGDAEAAEGLGNLAAAELGQQGADGSQALALAITAQAANARGDGAKAKSIMEKALALSHGEDVGLRLAVQVRAARLAAATGRRAEAAGVLAAIHEEAQRTGFVEPRLQADLTLAEIEAVLGHTAEARSRFSALAAEARQRGYGLIARKIKGFS